MKLIKVTIENYQPGWMMGCENCGESWDFASYEWEVDNRTNEEYKNPVCPECHGTLYYFTGGEENEPMRMSKGMS